MKNLNKFLLYRPEFPVYMEINQPSQIFRDKVTQFLAGKVFVSYILHDAKDYSAICTDAAVYIFSNLNLFLSISLHKISCFKPLYTYTFHEYCATKNQFVEHYGKI